MSTPAPVLYSDDYTGLRYRYAATLRPIQPGFTVPRDTLIGSLQPHPEYPHGTVEYPRRLTAAEVAHYRLVRLPFVPPAAVSPPTVESLQQLVDTLTVQYHEAQRGVLNEWGGGAAAKAALREEVNALRAQAGLGPSPVEPVYPEEEEEEDELG